MSLKIAYIATDDAPKAERKLSKKEELHRKALESLAATRIRDRERAKKRFAPEWAKVNALIKERDELREQLAKKLINDKL
jgi:hypothetical protein